MSNSKITFSTSNTVRPGLWTIKVISTDGKDHTLQILRLHQGYSVQQAQSDLGKAFSGDIPAINRIDKRITWRGGTEAHQTAGWFSTTLFATRYLVVDQNSNAHRWLNVTGNTLEGSAPATSGQINAYSYGFGTSGRLPANGWVRLWNQSDQPHFYAFQRVKESTTDRQVRRYFASGSQQQPPWALKANTSSAVISPYHGEGMHLALPAGKYLVACYWPDDETGMPHAMMGMWMLVHLT